MSRELVAPRAAWLWAATGPGADWSRSWTPSLVFDTASRPAGGDTKSPQHPSPLSLPAILLSAAAQCSRGHRSRRVCCGPCLSPSHRCWRCPGQLLSRLALSASRLLACCENCLGCLLLSCCCFHKCHQRRHRLAPLSLVVRQALPCCTSR